MPQKCFRFPFCLHGDLNKKWLVPPSSENSTQMRILFSKSLYSHHISPATLPIEVGVPVRGMLLIDTASIEWQRYGCTWMCFKRKEQGKRFIWLILSAFLESAQKKGGNKVQTVASLLHEKTNRVSLLESIYHAFWNNWVIYQSWKKGFSKLKRNLRCLHQ